MEFCFKLFHTLGLDELGKGIKPGLSRNEAYAIPVAIPPLAEQYRIVAKVDELMVLCDRLDAEQADAANAHTTLVDTLLATLTESRDAEELAANWQRLSQHFDTLLSSETSLDALKQTILQLAVMGKLVPQEPNDEPASEMLKRILTEKAKPMTAARIGEDKPLAVVSEEDVPFELPVDWVWIRFSYAWSSSFYGPRFGTDDYASTGGVPTIRTTDMQNGMVVMKNPPRVRLSPNKLPQYLLKRGDILVTRSGSIGTMAIFDSDEPAIPSAYLIRLRLTPEVSPRYTQVFLQAPLGQQLLGLNATSVGVPNVSAARMAAFPLPLPPLPEQHRIVAKVDELMGLCDRLKSDLAESRTRQARLATTMIESALKAA